jgi:two-component system chemotaxis sensor kinase CheA
MNVVETEILKIGGRMEIINHPGEGCTIVLKLPINLATINGTVIEIFNERYILPTLHIKQLLKPESSQWVHIKGKPDMIKIRNEVIQVVPIEKIMGIKDMKAHYREGMVIVIELEHKIRALPVKSVIGKQEIVVKPLGLDFRSLNFVSGATILGDGRASLILDIESLF